MRLILKYTIPIILFLITLSCNKSNHGQYITDKNFVLLFDSISPNGECIYLKYKFDLGVLGKSNEIWAVTTKENELKNLRAGMIPVEYRIIGWSADNCLQLEKDESYGVCGEQIELFSGMKYNGVVINVINE